MAYDYICATAAVLSKTFGLITKIMLTFYRAVIECPDIFNHNMVWIYHSEGKVVKTASRIIGKDLPSLASLYHQRLLGRTILISHDSSHPAHDLFDPCPPGRRFRSIKTRTNRFSSSFLPLAVQTEVIFPLSVVQTYSTFKVF